MRRLLILPFLWILLTGAFTEKFISVDTNSHQGYSTNGNDHYTIDTGTIYKRNDDATWSIAVTNSTPMSGLTGYDHLGDGDFYNGSLYLPCMRFTSCVDFSDSSICVYNGSDLTRSSATALPTNGGENEHDIAGLVIVPEDGTNGIIYVVDYCADTEIHKYDLSDYSYIGSVAMSASIQDRQGITVKGDTLYIAGGEVGVSDDEIYSVGKDGTSVTLVHTMSDRIAEGVDYNTNTLRIMIDPGATEKVYYLTDAGDGETKIKGMTLDGVTVS